VLVGAARQVDLPSAPAAVAHGAIRLDHAPRGRQQQRERELGGRFVRAQYVEAAGHGE
jgi:hypothetical protein